MAKLDQRGHEILDSKPMAMPIGFRRPPTLQEQVRQLVRTEMSRQAANKGRETFEEADDFDVGDDYDPTSPWELTFDQEIAREEIKAKQDMVQEEPKDQKKTDNDDKKVNDKKTEVQKE